VSTSIRSPSTLTRVAGDFDEVPGRRIGSIGRTAAQSSGFSRVAIARQARRSSSPGSTVRDVVSKTSRRATRATSRSRLWRSSCERVRGSIVSWVAGRGPKTCREGKSRHGFVADSVSDSLNMCDSSSIFWYRFRRIDSRLGRATESDQYSFPESSP